jgi:predicted phosphate transport protein (TIGR00153 family)
MEKVIDCVTELNPFIEAVLNGNAEERDRLQALIVERENEADALKKELRMHLPKSLFMPVDRRDVLEVLAFQDRVAGGARSVAGLIVGRQLNIPDPLKEPYRQLVSHCIDACNTAYSAIRELDELLETGFGPNEVEVVSQILQELDVIEQETDEQQVKLRKLLFDMEGELPPVDVMFLYSVIDRTGGIADRAQRVGSRFQLMLAK